MSPFRHRRGTKPCRSVFEASVDVTKYTRGCTLAPTRDSPPQLHPPAPSLSRQPAAFRAGDGRAALGFVRTQLRPRVTYRIPLRKHITPRPTFPAISSSRFTAHSDTHPLFSSCEAVSPWQRDRSPRVTKLPFMQRGLLPLKERAISAPYTLAHSSSPPLHIEGGMTRCPPFPSATPFPALSEKLTHFGS